MAETTTTTTRPRPTTTLYRPPTAELLVGEWCSNWLDYGTKTQLRAVVRTNPNYDWGWRDLDGNGYPCEDELGGTNDYRIPGRSTTTTTTRAPVTTMAERQARTATFRLLMDAHPVFSTYEYEGLENLARFVCSELRRGVSPDDVALAIFVTSPDNWDALSTGEFVGYATGGFCPEQ